MTPVSVHPHGDVVWASQPDTQPIVVSDAHDIDWTRTSPLAVAPQQKQSAQFLPSQKGNVGVAVSASGSAHSSPPPPLSSDAPACQVSQQSYLRGIAVDLLQVKAQYQQPATRGISRRTSIALLAAEKPGHMVALESGFLNKDLVNAELLQPELSYASMKDCNIKKSYAKSFQNIYESPVFPKSIQQKLLSRNNAVLDPSHLLSKNPGSIIPPCLRSSHELSSMT